MLLTYEEMRERAFEFYDDLQINIPKIYVDLAVRSLTMPQYAKEYQDKYPTYKGCIVCERWHRFDYFLEDIQKLDGYNLFINNIKPHGIHLDKDTKGNGSKIYSPETCIFITNKENVKEANRRRKGDTDE